MSKYRIVAKLIGRLIALHEEKKLITGTSYIEQDDESTQASISKKSSQDISIFADIFPKNEITIKQIRTGANISNHYLEPQDQPPYTIYRYNKNVYVCNNVNNRFIHLWESSAKSENNSQN